jgi:hypothetical protein
MPAQPLLPLPLLLLVLHTTLHYTVQQQDLCRYTYTRTSCCYSHTRHGSVALATMTSTTASLPDEPYRGVNRHT